jgi:transposase-like protein
MDIASNRSRAITTARRALIVQRVLVDGWSSAEAAVAFGVSQRLVDVWVVDYRRHGMTSLRRPAGESLAGELVQLTISQPVRGLASRIASGLRQFFRRDRVPQRRPLGRLNDDFGGE